MPIPGHHTLQTSHITAYTPSCGGTPVAAYIHAPFRSQITAFSGVLGGAITTADGTVTVTNVTQSTTIGTFTVTQSGSAAGKLFSGAPNSVAVANVNQDDVIALTPSGASGASIPMDFKVAFKAN